MRTSLISMALLATMATQAGAEQRYPTKPGTGEAKVTLSCYRGPWRDVVAWDRPNAIFIEDLVGLGYSYQQAHAIGERICRDEWGVDKPEYLKETLLRILKETPPG